MSHYRRARTVGASYFFTLATYRRQPILCDERVRHALRTALLSARATRPFTLDAWVLMPNHMHCIWTLPPGDADYAARWSLIARRVSLMCREAYQRTEWLTTSKRKHRESTLWQRRYWEHQIRNERVGWGEAFFAEPQQPLLNCWGTYFFTLLTYRAV